MDPAVDVALDWTLESTFDGWLEDPVAFSDGLAALFAADGYLYESAELWVSEEGGDWEPASDQPPGSIHELTGQGGDLFALQSSLFEDGGALWVIGPEGWREVIAHVGLEGVAVGPERIVAFHDGALTDPFELLGVFDTATLEPVEFSSVPDLGVDGMLYEGRVAALDDGFLAVVRWIVAPEEVEDRTLYSADGSTWVEHPTATSDDVRVWRTSFFPERASYEGLDLVAGPAEGSLLVTDDGLEFVKVEASTPLFDPVANEAGLFARTGDSSEIYHSTDGVNWRSLQEPPTWVGWSQFGDEGAFASGTVVAAGDDLVAVVLRGTLGGFGAVDDPFTEIWRADASNL